MSLKEDALKLHEGGKFATANKCKIETKDDLSLAYTPGVAEPCKQIYKNKDLVYKYTSKLNTVAVISDGTAVLGLGNIGPYAGIPVMEGKAALFKKFANIDTIPLCLNTTDVEEIIRTCKTLEPSLGGINLEDISAPRCVEIERRLIDELDIPVFHDDQHGTSIVVSAALINACKVTKQRLDELTVVVSGLGAAGYNVVKTIKKLGVKTIYGYKSNGVVDSKNYSKYNSLIKELIDEKYLDDKPGNDGTIGSILKGANVFIGVSAPGLVKKEMIATMVNPIVFALANPTPEISYEDAIEGGALIAATGRSDYPNQINNLLAFPGIFRGALDVNASKIVEDMYLSASHAIAKLVPENELTATNILPTAFDRRLVPAVAKAVSEKAIELGLSKNK